MHALSRPELVLFGAFDRHNFGDLLFPHIVGAMLGGRAYLAAGVARRDMRPYGGHNVMAIADVATAAGNRRVDLVHAGGELLTCDAWEAAVMTSPDDEAHSLANQRNLNRQDQMAWAQSRLRLPGQAPYCVPKYLFANPGTFLYNAVGGVELSRRSPAFQEEVARALNEADYVSVRDRATQTQLHKLGITAAPSPDPAVMVMELFGERIHQHGLTGETARMRDSFTKGYAAVQFSADFGDDATQDILAAQLETLPDELGIVCFRAGAAPWHDDVAVYRRLIGRLKHRACVFESLDIWSICALLAHARIYCGSSLHGRLVAHACGVPSVSLMHAGSLPGKLAAYLATWHSDASNSVVEPAGLGAACTAALALEPSLEQASKLAACYRDHFNTELLPRLAR